MSRRITVAVCLAVLGVAALVIWVCVKLTGPSGAPVLERIGSDGQASDKSSGSTEKKGLDWRVFQLPLVYAYFGDGPYSPTYLDQDGSSHVTYSPTQKPDSSPPYSPCYVDFENKTLYRWKDVALWYEQVPGTGPYGSNRGCHAKAFAVVIPIEPPVKYREVDGKYRPGYLDRGYWLFYAWKGVVLSKQELLDKS